MLGFEKKSEQNQTRKSLVYLHISKFDMYMDMLKKCGCVMELEYNTCAPALNCVECSADPHKGTAFEGCPYVCLVCGGPICEQHLKKHQKNGVNHLDIKNVPASKHSIESLGGIVDDLIEDGHWTNHKFDTSFTWQTEPARSAHTCSVTNNTIQLVGKLRVRDHEIELREEYLAKCASRTISAAKESAESFVRWQPSDATPSARTASPACVSSPTTAASQANLKQLLKHVTRRTPPYPTVMDATKQYELEAAVLAAAETAVADGYVDILSCGADELREHIENCNGV